MTPIRYTTLFVALALGYGAVQAEAIDDARGDASLPEANRVIAAQPIGQWTGFWSRSSALGDMGGLRSSLASHGISLGLTETSEYLGNVSGGTGHGFDYDGLTTLTLGLDSAKAWGVAGGTGNLSLIDIHGKNLSQRKLSNLQTASGIESDRNTKLWELWYQQATDDNRFDIKLGQQSVDQEFMTSTYSGLFLNTMMGWPAVPSYDLPAGGPAYPMSALGVRLRAHPTDAITVLAGVFDGDPTAAGNDHNRHGTAFSLKGGTLWIAELQYAINQPALGQLETGSGHKGLPGTYKVGMWYHNAQFADQRYGSDGLSLADPASSGAPLNHKGNYSFYAVADQLVWESVPDTSQGLAVFARAMGAPSDRNLVSFSLNSGVSLKGPFAGRDNDTVGLGFGYVQVASGARGLDSDTAMASGAYYPVRHYETFVEATYQYQVNPWLQIQSDIQVVNHPGGGVLNPGSLGGSSLIGREVVVGLRTNITF
ncbi:carbohydrate porin [Rhodoferax sp.]|uniref:carbohydrate porin n=1 Tax=Rhodoferax sp. TaxID=50421 RepID=UPI0025EE9F51|nr:carbohydrate porin [Rhodoferax sp.]